MEVEAQVYRGSNLAQCGYPPWFSLHHDRSQPRPLDLQIRLQPNIPDYSDPFHIPQIRDSFDEAAALIMRLRTAIERLQSDTSQHIIDEFLAESMGRVVFGSNQIERVGCGLDETMAICREVFLEQRSVLEALSPRSAEYHRTLEKIIHQPHSDISISANTISSRREVVNHAAAFVHIVQAFVKNHQPISSGLIKDTHRILVHDIPAEKVQSSHYAGVWRTQHVHAGSTNFVTPNYIPAAMSRFVSELNEKLHVAEEVEGINEIQKGTLDPFYIASFACSEFVNIHPFLDGNGRICRLLLNAILLKYAGVCAPIGEDVQDRAEYMEIVKRRSAEECGSGEFSGFVVRRALGSLRDLVVRLGYNSEVEITMTDL